ncbi:hypothetical protein HYPSUDRAFT_53361 [Hypholoma sublateritium FD-334 SS-4]|uniref:Uncharacterized protein n=1 Tax=Hypholoma sublateritium (strain FD-334 SS-4) TaxID=945553 RepID=A0A0D2LCX9_HYPSF|nr:hypothetical protein HYPSUDRAFT_53361 [Hypholoma sublateritium FD-334 SS-4]
MVKITNSLHTIATLCASLVHVGADIVIQGLATNPLISGATQIFSTSVVDASAISIQPAAEPVYVITQVQSLAPLSAMPVSITETLIQVQGASVYGATVAVMTTVGGIAVSAELDIICTGTGNGGEVDCIEEDIVSANGIATTVTTSYVAPTSPIFTITGTQPDSEAVPTATDAPTTAANAGPTTATNTASHLMDSLASTLILGLTGSAYAIFYSIY